MANAWLNDIYMKQALGLAEGAALKDEVPVGAVVVLDHDPDTGVPLDEPSVVGAGMNNREGAKNPFGHAEHLAMAEASQRLGRWRLTGCTLYVTLEPCMMCAGAIVLSRVDRVVYGARDPKAGAVESLYQVLADVRLNHRPQVVSGVLESECAKVLKDFFARKRNEKNV